MPEQPLLLYSANSGSLRSTSTDIEENDVIGGGDGVAELTTVIGGGDGVME
jgi:hypothetical protein